MAGRLSRGEIWLLHRARPDKRRPVLLLSRPALLRVLHTVTVAAVTSQIRGVPTEVELGIEHGLKQVSCVNLAHVYTVEQRQLRTFVGSLDTETMRRVCRALALACACEDLGAFVRS